MDFDADIYQRLFDLVSRDVPVPDLVVYLQAPIDLLTRLMREHAKREDVAGPLPGEEYLAELGEEAGPALRRAATLLPDARRRQDALALASDARERLRESLRDWRGWSYRRHRLASALAAR